MLKKDKPNILFIGLGMMGQPMAHRLIQAHYPLFVHDTNRETVKNYCNQIDAKALLPSDDLSLIDVVITMLPDSGIVESVILGVDNSPGVASKLKPGSIIIDMSSSEPMRSRELGASLTKMNLIYLDAPVSGGVKRAIDGSLAIMVGGTLEAFADVQPILENLGKNIFHVGDPGSGHAIKALNNYLSAITTLSVAEALIIGKRFGLDPNKMVDVFNSSSGKSNTTENKAKQFMLNGAFSAGFTAKLMLKDITIANQLGSAVNSSMELGEASLNAWRNALEFLGGDEDHTAIYRYVEQNQSA
jgi:3-hydroxyisobutyrate dehydrogenase